jgi:predicted GIY-YIG superfamily endonuclease
MIVLGDKYKRLVYIYEFSDNNVYIGLTYNSDKRNQQHLINEKSPVYKHIQKTGLTPEYKLLSDYIDVKEAQKLEKEVIEKYKSDGYTLLNNRKGGELGATTIYWTFERCKEEALKYDKRNVFKKLSSGAYNSALINKWLDEICNHMILISKKDGFWDIKENCIIEAKKYKSKSEFKKYCNRGYNKARINGWLDEICNHMENKHKLNNYWNYERCKEEASKFISRSHFKIFSGSAYQSSLKNNWLNEFFN